ncbi:MAG TPA: glutamate-cysteine ligase family protein [Candidatus Lokiarchaeia archaeon]|nr:glutamate-cysteine ligase family protein [Candidatus Lokiarchaeia archaeon]
MSIPSNELPCSIGNEIELQIVNDRGEILRGEELIKTWDAIFVNIKEIFHKSLEILPEEIRNRITGARKVKKEKQGRKLPYVEVDYQALGRDFQINVIGPDPNISQITWLMELVTPPAINMQEFAWWNVFLNTVLVKALPAGYWVLPLGLNPVEKEYLSGVTYGEHYHIGVDDPDLKLAIYTLIRNFVPHLIALSVNSPFINKKPTGTVKIADDGTGIQVLAKDCTRSLRLFNNKGQMGPVDKETYIPCMETLDQGAFCEVIRRKPPDDRFVDVYPFTSYGTIELRIFDTQSSLSRRLAIVAIIEALCLKAKRLIERGEAIPCVMSSVLIANREKAVLFGLHGKFTPDTMLPRSFGMTYNEDPQTGKQNGKLFQAVSSMLFFLKKEIQDLGFEDLIMPVLASITGNEKVKAPVSPADYLLYIYESMGGDMARALGQFKRFQQVYCTGSSIELGDPILDEWGLPNRDSLHAILPILQNASQSTVEAQADTEDIDFSSIDVEVTESQINKVAPIPYRISFMAASNGPQEMLEIMVIQQLIETQKKSEIVLATSFTKLQLMANKQATITSDIFPLIPRQDLFVGNKQCRLKFVLKARKEATAYSNAFRIELLPRYAITSEFKKRKLVASEKYDVKYKIGTTGTNTPGAHVGLTFKFQVLSGDLKTVLHQEEKKIDVKEQEMLAFKLAPQASWKERVIVLRLVAMLNEKAIARHEITDIYLEITEEEPSTAISKQAQKKGDFWPAKKPAISPPQSSTPDNKYKLVKSLAFSKSGNTERKQEPIHVPTISRKKAMKVENKPAAALRQKSTPSKSKPTARSNLEKVPASSKAASSSAVVSPGKKEKKSGLKPEPKPLAILSIIPLPFLEPLDPAIAKMDIIAKLQSPRLVAPGKKISIAYTLRKKGIIGENESLKLLAFLINTRYEFIVVLNERYKLAGETSIYSLNVDPGKQFRNWKPTSPFYVVFQVYKENALVGQSTYSDFELARFTTSSQVNWQKIDLLSGTIYPGMDAGFDIEVELKTMVNPVAFSIEASCQGATVSTDFNVVTEGTTCAIAPFRVPYQGLTTVPNATMNIKIKDSSGMTIKEQKKIVAIIAKGPTFVIPNASFDTFEGLDKTRLAFEIMNDSSIGVSCHVSILAIDLSCASKLLASKKIKLKGSETLAVEIEKIDIPLNAIRGDTVMIDFLVEIDDFNKIKNLIRKIIPINPSPGETIDVYFHGKLSNPDDIHDITRYVDNVNIALDFRKDITLDGCKARIMEIVDGVETRVIKTLKIPRGKERVHDSVTWIPPRAKNFPRLCKLEIQFVQDKDVILSDRVVSEPLFFTILPD